VNLPDGRRLTEKSTAAGPVRRIHQHQNADSAGIGFADCYNLRLIFATIRTVYSP